MPGPERRLAAILFSDIVGYTALMARDEAAGLRARERHRSLLGELAEQYHGQIVDENGDELVLWFAAVLDAVSCGLAAQARLDADPELRLRIGIHEGDVTFRAGRVYGDGVNLASRIRPLAAPGGVCVSDDAAHSLRGQPQLELTALGAQELKNVGRPVEVFAVRGAPSAPSSGVSTPVVRRVPGATWVAFALVLAVGAAVVWLRGSAPPPPPTSIAVLPFTDLSAAGDQAYLADGMAEELIGKLSRIEELRVVARTSAFAFKGKDADIREIGRALGVGVVVEGSVRRSQDRLRVTAQLVQVADGFHLWSESYDRRLDDVFAVQQEIAGAVASALRVRLVGDRGEVPPTDDLRAYELYLLGRHFWSLRTEAGMRRALQYYEEALAIDPGYALALSGVADANAMLWVYRFETDPEVVRAARRAATEALRLDPALGEAHASLARLNGLLGDWDWEAAEAHYRRALELNPGHATTHQWYAAYSMERGRGERGLAAIRRALELDPLSPVINRYAGFYEVLVGDTEVGLERMRRAVELSPESAITRMNLAGFYWIAGMEREAFGTLLERLPPAVQPQFREIQRSHGMVGVVAALLEFEQKRTGQPCPPQPTMAAAMYAIMGEAEGVFRCLEEAVSVGDTILLRLNPVWAPFRTDPRFDGILEKLGLAE